MKDITARLEMAGFADFTIDWENGVAAVFFEGLLARETVAETQERRRREFRARYQWKEVELQPRCDWRIEKFQRR